MFFGWDDKPAEVEKVKATLKYVDCDQLIRAESLLGRISSGPVLPYLTVRKIIGSDVACGPQKIGDCVSWGWGGCVNYLQIMKIAAGLNKLDLLHLRTDLGGWVREAQDHPNFEEANNLLYEYQEACTEWIYGSSRVEVGGQRGDTRDGSVGAWAAVAVTSSGKGVGVATRKKYGPYDPQRAKSWGAQGVPDDYEEAAKKHVCTDVVPCTSYNQLVTMLRAYRFVPVCSNQGFTEQRDSKGACQPEGTWNHCMLFCGLDDRDWPLIAQSWGPTQPGGSRYLDQPSNTFFCPPETADKMLRQNDSFSPAGFLGFEVEDFINWRH
jgi:hypothetical protein